MRMVFQAVQFYYYQLWYNNIIVIVNFLLLSDWSGLGVGITSITLTGASLLLAPCKHSKRLYLLPRSMCSQDIAWKTKNQIFKQDLSNSFPSISFVSPAVYFASQRQQTAYSKCFDERCKSCMPESLWLCWEMNLIAYSWSKPQTRKLLVRKVTKLNIKELPLQTKMMNH